MLRISVPLARHSGPHMAAGPKSVAVILFPYLSPCVYVYVPWCLIWVTDGAELKFLKVQRTTSHTRLRDLGTVPLISPSPTARTSNADWGKSCQGRRRRVRPDSGYPSSHREAGVAWLDPQLCQHPDAVGQLQRLVEHVLALHIPLGDGEDVTALQLVACSLCGIRQPWKAHIQWVQGESEWNPGGWGASPVLSGQSLIWNWASFSLGMSFHVAKNICRSTG